MAHRKIDWEQFRKNVEMENNFDFSNKLRTLSLEDQQKEVRSLLQSFGTDMEQTDADPFGNGDLSVIHSDGGRTGPGQRTFFGRRGSKKQRPFRDHFLILHWHVSMDNQR
mmetsp:Transcript_6882/g.15986  ORF Transcript_6882/g.15986 Transcript_6882/m.15986 type:complete len:110 (-) Transcript_6882:2150-2479(-)